MCSAQSTVVAGLIITALPAVSPYEQVGPSSSKLDTPEME